MAVAIGLQYLQMRQLNSRNPGAAQANPQMQMMQRYMPLIFAVIYIRISAGVNIYFVVSSLCRIGIQEGIFRSGVLDKTPTRREGNLPSRGGGGGTPRRSIMERLADAQQRALEQQKARQSGLQPEIDAPKRPRRTTQTPASQAAAKPVPPATRVPCPPTVQGSANGAAKPKDPGKPGGGAKRPPGPGNTTRPGGADTNGGARSGSSKAGSNGAPAPKEQPTGQPRSAKKRPRKAR